MFPGNLSIIFWHKIKGKLGSNKGQPGILIGVTRVSHKSPKGECGTPWLIINYLSLRQSLVLVASIITSVKSNIQIYMIEKGYCSSAKVEELPECGLPSIHRLFWGGGGGGETCPCLSVWSI